jgi:uncharacterized protein involved in exopolysaccharide biosynthesis/Mrp family chromosome partitioning ATPase
MESNNPFLETGPDQVEAEESNFLRQSWLMVLERKWYALTVFLVTMLAAAAYTFLSTPIYGGTVSVQVLKHGAQILRVADVVESSVTTDTDFNTQIKVLESITIIQNVAARLTPDELKLLTDPYKSRTGEPPSAVGIIYEHRKIVPQRLSLIVAIQYLHPSPKMAARVANLLASEYIAYNSRLRIEESLKAVDELKDRADQQRKRVDEIANSLQAFRQRGNLISLMQSKDIVTEKLKALNLQTTQTSARLKEAEVRWNQVQDWTKKGRDLSELPFIGNQAKVSQLILQLSTQKLAFSQLQERYKTKHPRLIEANNGLEQTEAELQGALTMAANSIKSEYENALQNDEGARKALADQEGRSLDLDKSSVEYENLNRDFRVNEQLLESMMARMRETSVTSSIEMESARIIDRAFESATPLSPKIAVNLAIGMMGGIFLGFSVAFLVATIDDKIKTPFDVETLVGLPLLGVIPRVERMEQPDKAQIVSNGADRMVTEAFLSLYSTLRVNDQSRNARLILLTSTLPGEGKSFLATNLALTYASQGQRTIIVDCDLRKPNIERSFRLHVNKGVVNYCANAATLEEIIVKNVHPNLDVITVGNRAKNPIKLLNSKEFEGLVAELSYTIRFNGAKRGAVQRCVQRLRSANIPVIGAVMNDMKASLTGQYYYMETSSKAIKDYYDPKIQDAQARAAG